MNLVGLEARFNAWKTNRRWHEHVLLLRTGPALPGTDKLLTHSVSFLFDPDPFPFEVKSIHFQPEYYPIMPSTCAFAETWNNAIDGLIRENQHDVPDDSGKAPLWLVASYGYSECVYKLCGAGVDIDRRNRLGQTALFQVTTAGHTEVVEILLNHGADPNICGENGLSPIYQAIMNGHKEIVELLLSRNPMISSTGPSSIWRAATQPRVHLLSQYGITPQR